MFGASQLQVARLLAQHAGSYVELGAAAAIEYRRVVMRRLACAVGFVAFGICAVAAVWGAGLVLAWNTPWRITYAVTAALVLIAAAAAFLIALRRSSAGPHGMELSSEVRKDLELFHQWRQTL